MESWWLGLLPGIAAGLVLAWIALIVAPMIVRPRGGLLHEAGRHGKMPAAELPASLLLEAAGTPPANSAPS